MIDPAPVPLERLTAELRELYRQRDDLMRSAGTVPTLPEEGRGQAAVAITSA